MEPRLYKRGFDDDIVILETKLKETTLLLEVLAKINSLITKTKTFEGFCAEVVKILKEQLKFEYIYIWIRDEKDPNLLRLVTPEAEETYRTMSLRQGIVGKSIREARTVCTPDVTLDPDYLVHRHQTKSELCVPLISENSAMGAINIETETYQDFQHILPIIGIIAENLSHSMKLAFLYRTEEQFHQLVEHMSEGVWVGDREQRTIYTNKALQLMMEAAPEELFGKLSEEYFDRASWQKIVKENEKRRHGIASNYEATLVSKKGERIPVLIHGVPFGSGGSMGTVTDLRQIKSTEQKLIQAERFLTSITQYCAEAIVGLDLNDNVQSWNVGAQKIFGYKEEEIIGKPIACIIPDDRRIAGESQQIIEEVKTKGSVRNFETVRAHKNGTPITISLTCSAVKDMHGNIIGLSALYRDITAQKKWERELQDRFEKMQEAYREMGRQRRFLDYLTDMINMATSSHANVKQIATFLVNAMVMATKVDAATFRLLDSASGKLTLVAQSGLGEEWWTKKSVPYSGSLLEKAVAQGYALKILDILSDPRYSSPGLARKNNLRSALVIPLLVKNGVLGSLTLYLSQEGNLSLLDDEFIMVFAKQAALVLKSSEQK